MIFSTATYTYHPQITAKHATRILKKLLFTISHIIIAWPCHYYTVTILHEKCKFNSFEIGWDFSFTTMQNCIVLQKLRLRCNFHLHILSSLGEDVDKMIKYKHQPITPHVFLCTNLLKCMNENKMKVLLPKLQGIEKAVILMVIHLCSPQLRSKCQAVSKIPLGGFRTVSDIREYTRNIIDHGVSDQTRGWWGGDKFFWDYTFKFWEHIYNTKLQHLSLLNLDMIGI